jgi:hypothetical protein
MDLGAFGQTINNLITVAQAIGLLLFVFFLSMAGFYFMTSGGSPNKIEQSKSAAFNACIGLALILSARTIQALVSNMVVR